jgi:hypothetical protein
VMYFVYVYQNKTVKSVEIVLRRGGRMSENDRGGKSN